MFTQSIKSCQKPLLGQIEWWVQNGPITKKGVLRVTTFLKILFQFKNLLCTNYSNVHIHTFRKRWSFIWLCFLPVSILNYKKILHMHWIIWHPANFFPVFSLVTFWRKNRILFVAYEIRSLQFRPQGPPCFCIWQREKKSPWTGLVYPYCFFYWKQVKKLWIRTWNVDYFWGFWERGEGHRRRKVFHNVFPHNKVFWLGHWNKYL